MTVRTVNKKSTDLVRVVPGKDNKNEYKFSEWNKYVLLFLPSSLTKRDKHWKKGIAKREHRGPQSKELVNSLDNRKVVRPCTIRYL